MPRYFFDTDDGMLQMRDEIGLELTNDQAARDEASRALTELAQDYTPGDAPQKNVTMWVRNESGEALLQLSLTFAIQSLR